MIFFYYLFITDDYFSLGHRSGIILTSIFESRHDKTRTV